MTDSIQVGETYLFRYKAKNIHCWSLWSASLSLIAASVPTEISPAAVTFNEGTDVRLQWTLPSDDGGKPITQYSILI